jgi:hypothetical protein
MRIPICAAQRLAVTLRFLAVGDNYHSLSYEYRMGVSTVSNIIDETCLAIYESLRGEYLKLPNTQAEWKEVSDGYWTKWQMPFCCVCIDYD